MLTRPAEYEPQPSDANYIAWDGTNEEVKADLLRSMPSLFSEDLPPCNAIAQVAYEQLVHALRQRWLSCNGKEPAADTCRIIQSKLTNQNMMWPACANAREKPKSTPPRNEAIFKWKLRWISYFVREAESFEPITESSIIRRQRGCPVPYELELRVIKMKPDVLEMWRVWRDKKRANPPSSGNGEQADGDVTESFDDTNSKCEDEQGATGPH
ncbi:hypothetical protein BU23DRAFT_97346 [Bimuria novae-zelandiae CBS 107.79]|uniref:Uncharacterized protein n=1 Tax=Bimuria novae-zelandiae CBS 107.79 TaxID=1447943 RepID=A0A6A5VHX8_9PLEO|nr:hypothetical protein BU23DRAFT_97346 [Bimuria novae-zelandiae CBS 107.79]